MTAVRGIRGATTADSDTREAILEAAEELLKEICAVNEVDPADIASIFFTTIATSRRVSAGRRSVGMGWQKSPHRRP